MKPLRLLIAVVILGGLGVAIWYSEKHPPQPKSEVKTEKVLTLKEDEFKKIQITRPGGEGLALEKADDGKWRITQPKAYKADESSVSSMVSNLTSLNADRVVEEKASDWASYGLEPGKIIVQIGLKDGKEKKLTLGDEAPTSSAVYARLDGDPRLFTIASYVKSSIDKPAADLRDKRVLPFDSEKTTRVTVKTKERELEFGKAGTTWQIVKPRPMRADNFAVDDLVRSVREANFESVLEESEKPSGKYSFSSPYATFEAADAAGAHVLTIGVQKTEKKSTDSADKKDKKEKKKEFETTYYAKTTDAPGVFKISTSVAEGLNKKLEDLRNKKLFDFGWNDPQKLEVRDGEVRMVIEKKGDKWQRTDAGNKELPSDKVQTLIDNLRNLSSKAFAADEASAQARYGLGKPAAEAKVTSDDGKRVERVLIAAGPESKYYAARENEPATYEIDKSSHESIQKAITELKDAPPPAPAKK